MNNSLYNKEWLKGTYHLQVVAYYFRQWKELNMSFHAHNQCEIMYVVSGNCNVSTEEKTYFMKKGDFILVDANVKHKLAVDKDEPCRILNLEFVFASGTDLFNSVEYLAKNSESFCSVYAGINYWVDVVCIENIINEFNFL